MKIRDSTTFREKNEECRDTCMSTISNSIHSDNDRQFTKLAEQKSRVKEIQIDCVIQAHLRYFLTSSLKYQYLVKTKPFSIEKKPLTCAIT